MRYFNKKQRAALFTAAGGHCETCGVEITEFHAGHGVAYAKGGPTTMANGKAQCAACNLAEGDKSQPKGRGKPLPRVKLSAPFQPHAWQRDFAAVTAKRKRAGEKTVVGDIITGAGKTFGALYAYTQEVAPKLRRPVVLAFAPRANIAHEWRATARGCGLNLAAGIDLDFTREVERGNVHGAALTYQWLENNAPTLELLSARFDLVVIHDEGEWVADGNSWGTAISEYASQAAFTMILSSTLFRTNPTEVIVGMEVMEVHFSYGYKDGLRDKVSPRLSFIGYNDTIRWTMARSDTVEHFDMAFTEGNERDANGQYRNIDMIRMRLNAAVSHTPNTDNPFVATMLSGGVRDLAMVRKTHPTAGGMVIANTIHDAQCITDVLRKMGESAVMVSSDTPGSAGLIVDFRKGGADWLVSVDMCGVGTNIPRLRVMVYLSAITAERRFRQYVGRLLRLYYGIAWEDQDCIIRIPSDPRLVEMLERICEPAPPREIPTPSENNGGGSGGERRQIVAMTSDGAAISLMGTVGEATATLADEKLAHRLRFFTEMCGTNAPSFDLPNNLGAAVSLMRIISDLQADVSLQACTLPVYLSVRDMVSTRLVGIGVLPSEAPVLACALVRTASPYAAKLVQGRPGGFRGAW